MELPAGLSESGHAPLDSGAGRFTELFYDFLDEAEDAAS